MLTRHNTFELRHPITACNSFQHRSDRPHHFPGFPHRRCDPGQRGSAEIKFKEIRGAYESILRGQAGYTPPPPNTPPHEKYATAYWEAQTRDGRVPWGPYNGYQSEWAYYTARAKRSRNSVAMLSFAGLIGVPMLAIFFSQMRSGEKTLWGRIGEGGMDSLKNDSYRVNGVETNANPFAASSDRSDSYIYKHKQFENLKDKPWMK